MCLFPKLVKSLALLDDPISFLSGKKGNNVWISTSWRTVPHAQLVIVMENGEDAEQNGAFSIIPQNLLQSFADFLKVLSSKPLQVSLNHYNWRSNIEQDFKIPPGISLSGPQGESFHSFHWKGRSTVCLWFDANLPISMALMLEYNFVKDWCENTLSEFGSNFAMISSNHPEPF